MKNKIIIFVLLLCLVMASMITCYAAEANPVTKNVTGYVYPMVLPNDYWGDNFHREFDIVVELRKDFSTPTNDPNLSVVSAPVGNDGIGKFTFENVPEGDYILYIKRPGYLVRGMKVSVGKLDPPEIFLTPPGSENMFNLWAGDINQDLVVTAIDIQAVVYNCDLKYGDIRYLPDCDVNGDGIINIDDISIVSSNGGKSFDDYAGVEGIYIP